MSSIERDRSAREVLQLVVVVAIVVIFAGYLFKAQCNKPDAWGGNQYAQGCYNDIQPLYGIRGVQARIFPYVYARFDPALGLTDGAIEYPVLTGVFMWFTGLFVTTTNSYLNFSALLLAPFGIFTAYLLGKMTGWRALMWAASPALVLYSFHNWDLLVVAAVVAGFWFWSRGQPLVTAILFGVGGALKMYPLFFLAPLALERYFASETSVRVKEAVRTAAVGAGTFLAINLPFMIVNFSGWFLTYSFHQDRGADFNSIWHWWQPLWGPDTLNKLSAVLVGLFFIGALAIGWVQAKRKGSYPLIQVCGAMLAIFLLWNKVHSPQYALWIAPFFVLLRVNVSWWIAYSVADLFVYFGIFRWFYDSQYRDPPIDMGTAKRALLIGIWARAALLLVMFFVFLASKRATNKLEAEVVSHPPHKVSRIEEIPQTG